MCAYKAKSRLSDEAVYSTMMMLESAIEADATREWEEAVAMWGPGADSRMVRPLIEKAVQRVSQECQPFCADLGHGAKGVWLRVLSSWFEPVVRS